MRTRTIDVNATTQRETEVLELVRRRLSNKEIAELLQIRESTVQIPRLQLVLEAAGHEPLRARPVELERPPGAAGPTDLRRIRIEGPADSAGSRFAGRPSLCACSGCRSRPRTRRTVGWLKMTRSGTFSLKVSCMREASCIARSEWPPSSKKFSSTPMSDRPRTSRHRPARRSSVGVLGRHRTPTAPRRALAAFADPLCRSRSAASRRAARSPTAACSRAAFAGGCGRRAAMTPSSDPGLQDDVGDEPLVARAPARRRRRSPAPPTGGCRARVSISPSSMRWPRIFT